MSIAEPSATLDDESSTTIDRSWPAAGWICAAALVLLFAIYADTIAGLLDNWLNSSAYGHALLILPISAWLVWRDRAVFAALEPRPCWPALLIVALGALGWLLGDVLSIRVARELALYQMFVGTVWATLGTRIIRQLAFPLGYLLLTIPVWSVLITPLQDGTAIFSTRSLQAVGVPVFLDGYYMQIPRGQFVVEEVCAGLRFLLATMAIVALHARLSLHSAWRRWLLLGAAVVSAVVFNWIRVDAIVLAGYLGGMQHPLVTNHIAFGWIMFIVSLAPIMALSWWLQRNDAPALAPAGGERASASRPTANALAAGLALLLAVPGAGLGSYLESSATRTVDISLGSLPSVPGFEGPEAAQSGLNPRFATAHARTEQRYRSAEGDELSVFVAYYARQREGVELVSDTNRLFGAGWTGNGAAVMPTGGANGLPDDVVETLAQSPTAAGRLIWYWYYAGGRFTTSRLQAKLLQLLDLPLLRRHPRGAAMVAISMPIDGDPSREARAKLAELAAPLLPRLKKTFAEVDTKW